MLAFAARFVYFVRIFRKRVITSSSVSLGEVLINISAPRNATLLKLFLIDVWNTLFVVYVFPHS